MGSSKADKRKPKSSRTRSKPRKQESARKGTPWADVKHFKPREFTCNCRGLCDHSDAISPELVAKLDVIRDLMGTPLTITSGTRCERYNRHAGGRRGSAHVPKDGVSRAADVFCPDSAFRFAFLTAALPLFNRIGIGKDFIHVDDDPTQPSNLIWVY
jgi:hypothetical protein